ncbi:MAG: FAD-dependent oxidoreductase [Erysipelotrichaceae bacterium]|nr:FAD-dependent oxidoreductase [Erysipelotrichaceae bacterium]
MRKLLKLILSAVLICSMAACSNTPATDNSAKNEPEIDVLVVGGGASGLSAAVEAAGAGSKVVLIEKASNLGGSTNYSAGATVRNATDEEASTYGALKGEELVEYFMTVAEQNADRDFIEFIVSKADDTVNWLKGMGYQSDYMAYEGCNSEILSVEWGVGGNQMIQILTDKATELGVEIVMNTAATELILDESGTVTGVKATNAEGEVDYLAKSVVLATGSYIQNKDLIAQHTELVDVLPLTGAPGNTGDGLKMAEAVNAKMTFKGPGLLSSWTTTAPIGAVPQAYFVAVDPQGNRFVNEVEFYSVFANEAIKKGISQFWLVYDANTIAHDMSSVAEHETMLSADSLDELAGLMNVDAATLKATIDSYNALCDKQEDTEYGKNSKYLEKVETGPYYALTAFPLAIGTFGGLSIDENSQVLDVNNAPIANLYAAGEVANADFFGEVYPISGSCLTYATTTGRIAGQVAAENAK